jgi:hypothetical protein
MLTGFAILFVAGCAEQKPVFPSDPYAPGVAPSHSASVTNGNMIVTLDPSASGRVASVNTTARFVVLNYPLGHMPAAGQGLSLYRRGLKVGEIKVTGPQQDDNTVADLVTGEAQIGDEVRAK